MSAFVAAVVVTAASIGYSYTQAKKAKKQAAAAAEAAKEATRGTQVPSNISGGALDIPYGICKIGGYQVFAKTKSNVQAGTSQSDYDYSYFSGLDFSSNYTGEKNEYLFLQQALCVGGISSVKGLEIDDIIINQESLDVLPSAMDLKGSFAIGVSYNGNIANSLISVNFPERQNALFSNIAYLTGLFKINRDEPQYNGIPSVSLVVEGKKVRKVNYSSVNNTYQLGSYVFSNNSADVLLDYLLTYANVKEEEIDLESFYNASQVCNRVVDTKVFTGSGYSTAYFKNGYSGPAANQITLDNTSNLSVGQFVICTEAGLQSDTRINAINGNIITLNKNILTPIGSSSDKKIFTIDGSLKNISLYQFNGTLSTENTHRDNIEKIVNTMENGILLWSEGKYKIVLTYPETFSSIPVAATITDDEILDSNVSILWPDIEDKFNNVEVRFNNALEEFQDDSVYALEVN